MRGEWSWSSGHRSPPLQAGRNTCVWPCQHACRSRGTHTSRTCVWGSCLPPHTASRTLRTVSMCGRARKHAGSTSPGVVGQTSIPVERASTQVTATSGSRVARRLFDRQEIRAVLRPATGTPLALAGMGSEGLVVVPHVALVALVGF